MCENKLKSMHKVQLVYHRPKSSLRTISVLCIRPQYPLSSMPKTWHMVSPSTSFEDNSYANAIHVCLPSYHHVAIITQNLHLVGGLSFVNLHLIRLFCILERQWPWPHQVIWIRVNHHRRVWACIVCGFVPVRSIQSMKQWKCQANCLDLACFDYQAYNLTWLLTIEYFEKYHWSTYTECPAHYVSPMIWNTPLQTYQR